MMPTLKKKKLFFYITLVNALRDQPNPTHETLTIYKKLRFGDALTRQNDVTAWRHLHSMTRGVIAIV